MGKINDLFIKDEKFCSTDGYMLSADTIIFLKNLGLEFADNIVFHYITFNKVDKFYFACGYKSEDKYLVFIGNKEILKILNEDNSNILYKEYMDHVTNVTFPIWLYHFFNENSLTIAIPDSVKYVKITGSFDGLTKLNAYLYTNIEIKFECFLLLELIDLYDFDYNSIAVSNFIFVKTLRTNFTNISDKLGSSNITKILTAESDLVDTLMELEKLKLEGFDIFNDLI